MHTLAQPVTVDHDALEGALKTLASANRLRLLELLRSPRLLDEIHLRPAAERAGDNPDRPITRQAVRHHLDAMRKQGLCISAPAETGTAHTWVADHSRLFAIAEDLRAIASLGQPRTVDMRETVDLQSGPTQSWDEGPKLVLVHGVREGQAYPLHRKVLPEGRGWVVGRRRDVAVPITYDPYVSSENAEILPTGGGYELLDLRTAKNGTWLNWQRLPIGGRTPLRSGDVIGVGRSLLVFRAD